MAVTTVPPQFSPDGNWWWTGTTWIPAPPTPDPAQSPSTIQPSPLPSLSAPTPAAVAGGDGGAAGGPVSDDPAGPTMHAQARVPASIPASTTRFTNQEVLGHRVRSRLRIGAVFVAALVLFGATAVLLVVHWTSSHIAATCGNAGACLGQSDASNVTSTGTTSRSAPINFTVPDDDPPTGCQAPDTSRGGQQRPCAHASKSITSLEISHVARVTCADRSYDQEQWNLYHGKDGTTASLGYTKGEPYEIITYAPNNALFNPVTKALQGITISRSLGADDLDTYITVTCLGPPSASNGVTYRRSEIAAVAAKYKPCCEDDPNYTTDLPPRALPGVRLGADGPHGMGISTPEWLFCMQAGEFAARSKGSGVSLASLEVTLRGYPALLHHIAEFYPNIRGSSASSASHWFHAVDVASGTIPADGWGDACIGYATSMPEIVL